MFPCGQSRYVLNSDVEAVECLGPTGHKHILKIL